jgi:IS30 family transposase
VTVDNGKEFSGHKGLAQKLGCDIYFAHPYHSWERGLNEHTNGLIRQYLPERTSFEGLTQRQLDRIIEKINNRPRKALGYRTPNEVFPSIFSHFKLELADHKKDLTIIYY